MNESCLFCKIAAGQINAQIVVETDDLIAFDDINPQAPVHILIIPRKHIAKAADCAKEDEGLIGKMVTLANEVAGIKEIVNSGYRLVINNGHHAGQEVMHLHLHLLGGRPFHWPPG